MRRRWPAPSTTGMQRYKGKPEILESVCVVLLHSPTCYSTVKHFTCTGSCSHVRLYPQTLSRPAVRVSKSKARRYAEKAWFPCHVTLHSLIPAPPEHSEKSQHTKQLCSPTRKKKTGVRQRTTDERALSLSADYL